MEIFEPPSLICKLAKTYTGEARAFVVYKTGTIVFSDSALARSDDDYGATLLDVMSGPQNFTVQQMVQRNFLVRFKGPVTGMVLNAFYEENQESIRRAIDEGGLLPGEEVRLNTDASVPENHYYVGLYARAKLYADVQRMEICERFRP